MEREVERVSGERAGREVDVVVWVPSGRGRVPRARLRRVDMGEHLRVVGAHHDDEEVAAAAAAIEVVTGGGGDCGGAEHGGVPAVGVGRPGEAGQVRAAARGGVPDGELAVDGRVAGGVPAQEGAAMSGVERAPAAKEEAVRGCGAEGGRGHEAGPCAGVGEETQHRELRTPTWRWWSR